MSKPIIKQLRTAFILTCALIMTAAGVSKAIELWRGDIGLEMSDIVLQMVPLKYVIGMAIAVDVGVVLMIIWLKNEHSKVLSILWASIIFSIYRLGSIYVGPGAYGFSAPCPCLGQIGSFDSQLMQMMANLLFWYMLSGGVLFTLSNYFIEGTKRWSTRSVCLPICLTFTCMPWYAQTAETNDAIKVSGFLTTSYAVGEISPNVSTNAFTIYFHKCQSLVRIDGKSGSGIEYKETGTDGKDTYYLVRYGGDNKSDFVRLLNPKSGKIEEVIDKKKISFENRATLTVSQGVAPYYVHDHALPVWLAYQADCIFQKKSGAVREIPIYPIGENPSARAGANESRKQILTRWTNSTVNPSLIEQIQLLRDGVAVFGDGNQTVSKSLTSLAINIPDEYYSFKITGWTNFAGVVIPSAFGAVRTAIKVTDGQPMQKEITKYEGRISEISVGEVLATYIPEIPPMTRVIDRRLIGNDPPMLPVDYMSTNGNVLSVQKLRKTERYQDLKKHSELSQKASKRSNMVIIFLTIFIVVSGIYFAWEATRKQQNKTR